MDTLCCDKTGTLTQARLRLTDNAPAFIGGIGFEDLLVAAALATRWREPPRDALDALVLGAVDPRSLGEYEQLEHFPFDSVTKRTESTLRRPDGSVFKVSKGAPHALLALASNQAAVRGAVEAQVAELARRGVRALGVACTNTEAGGWVLMGILTFTDPLRADSADMARQRPPPFCARAPRFWRLRGAEPTTRARSPQSRAQVRRVASLGVRIKMLTGDDRAVAAETCAKLGLSGAVRTAPGVGACGCARLCQRPWRRSLPLPPPGAGTGAHPGPERLRDC